MTTRATVQPVGRRRRYTELPDPPKKLDMLHDKHAIEIKSILVARYEHRPDVLVAGEGYLCRHTRDIRDPQGHLVPDCVIAFGVDGAAIVQSNGYTISEVGKPPDFVLEIASRSTGTRDYTIKREIYARFGVREYWRFDPSGGRYYGQILAADLLVDGVYRPMEIHHAPSGAIWGYSALLNLELRCEDDRLRLYDPATGEYLPKLSEESQRADAEHAARVEASQRADAEYAARVEASQRADAEYAARVEASQRADEASQRADAEHAARVEASQRADEASQRADEASQRADEAEAEARRLQELLDRLLDARSDSP